MDKCLKPLQKASVGTVVWGKLRSYRWWPAIIINSSDCGQSEAKFGNLWLFWFGDHKISEVLANRCNHRFDNMEALIFWAKNGFQSSDENLISISAMPTFVLKHLSYLQKSEASENNDEDDYHSESAVKIFNTNIPLKMVREGALKIQDVCIACYENKVEIVDFHPLCDGGLCFQCKEDLQENMFVYGNDGKSMCCIICAKPGSLILCDNINCHRSFCSNCMTLLLGPDEKKKIIETNPWYCFYCSSNDGCGLLRIKTNWEDRIIDFFQPPEVAEKEVPLDFMEKKPIRVLSLFDGIGTGKFVLDNLGFEVEVYYASEIDENAINVSKFHHKDSISYIGDVTELTDDKIASLGPIDLIIGGSPCNDLSLVNPLRKGIYDINGTGQLFFDFFYILNTLRRFNNPKHVFFFFENVAAMSKKHKSIISTFLGLKPALIDAKFVSPQIRPRYFWGNIPGLHKFNKYCSSLHNDVPPIEDTKILLWG